MRITTTLFVCSTLGACLPETRINGGQHNGVDAGSNTTEQACSTPTAVSGDLLVSGSSTDFANVPSTCWTLAGKLTISGSSMTSLEKLGTLQSVGSLEIASTMLTKLDTKQAITVSGDVSIHDNTALADISNLSPASTINSLTVQHNDVLASLGKFSGVTRVTGPVSIQYNTKLATLDMGAVTRVESGLTIANNPALTTTNLVALSSVTGAFIVQNNNALTDLGSLAGLSLVHGDILIDNNPVLANLDNTFTTDVGLDAGFGLTITNNAKLTGLGQISHASVGGYLSTVDISNNGQLNYCFAKEVACCVAHQSSPTIQNDTNMGGGCNGILPNGHSWCYVQLGYCPYPTN